LDKIGAEGVEQELATRGLDSRSVAELIQLFRRIPHITQSPKDGLGWLTDLVDAPGAKELRTIFELAQNTAAGRFVRIDPSLARGLSYYTGAIMEIAVPDLAGSLGGGGRYDNLIGMFLGRDIPACGFSLGLERIIVVMSERNMFPATVVGGGVDVMVTLWNDQTRADSLALASEFRAAGLRVDLYPDADKLGKQFKYAASRNVPFVAVLGDDERSRNKVSIKDLRSGEQQTIARGEAVQFVVARRQ
jgi:histidyl-tRNA synthetase